MRHRWRLGSWLGVVLLALGCAGHHTTTREVPDPERGVLLVAEQVGEPVTTAKAEQAFANYSKIADDLLTAANDQTLVKFLVEVVWTAAKQASHGHNYWVTAEKIMYTTRDAKGNLLQVSGLVFIPWQSLSKVNAPILMLQHGTQIYRDYAPSRFLYDMWKYLEDPKKAMTWGESIVGYMVAHAGYIVVMPDYPGMGINRSYHPYMDPSIAHCVTDLFKAIQTRLNSDTWKPWTTWNQQLLLTGYSEGGYATMQAAREFQEQRIPVTAVATLDGPFDLSTTMRQVMIAQQPSSAPYFLPYTLVSFQNLKGDTTYGYAKTMVAPYATTLPPMMNGSFTSDQVKAAMPRRADGQYPRDILTPSFIEALSKPFTGNPTQDGPVLTDLAANDAYRGWKPTMPLRLFHCQTDDLVPVGNSRAALAAWISLTNVTGIQDVSPLALEGQAVHVAAALPAYLEGFLWLDTFRKQ